MEYLELSLADYLLKHGDTLSKELDERRVEAQLEQERTFQQSYDEQRLRELHQILASATGAPYGDVAGTVTRGFLQKVTGKDAL